MKLRHKFIRYAIVGLFGTFTHVGLLILFVEWLFLPPVFSSSTAFIIVVIISYCLNYRWTFNAKSKHKTALFRYGTVSLIGFLLNLAIMFFLVDILQLWYLFGQMISAIFVSISNFTLNSKWTFKARR